MKYILFIAVMGFSIANADTVIRKPNPEITKARALFCKGDFPALKKMVAKAKPSDEAYLRLRLILLNTKAGEIEAAKKLEHFPSKVDSLSETKRIELAATLFASSSKDIAKLKALLDFKSKSAVIEGYRQLYTSYIEASANNGAGVAIHLQKADELIPYPDPWLMVLLLNIYHPSRNMTSFESTIGKRAELFSEDDGFHYEILAHEGYAHLKVQNMDQIGDGLKKAYDLCKYDQYFAIAHLGVVMMYHDLDKAEAILSEIKKDHLFLSPEYFYNLAKLHLGQLKYDVAENDISSIFDYLTFEPAREAKYREFQKQIQDVQMYHSKDHKDSRPVNPQQNISQ